MAFTFLVEDGTGLTAANAYVSAADALDLLFTDTARYTVFNAADTPTQQSALSLASDYLDSRYKWDGTKYVDTSGLRWPRQSACDRDGVEIATDALPKALLRATALMAALILEGKASFSDSASTTQAYPLTELKVDVITLNFQVPDTDQTLSLEKVPNEIKLILQGIGGPINANVSFVKINK